MSRYSSCEDTQLPGGTECSRVLIRDGMKSTGATSPWWCHLHKVAITGRAQGGELAGIPVLGNFSLQSSVLQSVFADP